MSHKLRLLLRMALWPAIIIAAVTLGLVIVFGAEQRQTKDCCKDAGALIAGVEVALGADDLDSARKILLATAEAAGYYCEPKGKGWTCR